MLGAYTHLTFVFVVASHAAAVLFLEIPSLSSPRQGFRRLAMPLAAIFLSAALSVGCYAPMLRGVVDYYVHGSVKMKGLSTPLWALFETLRGLELGFGSQLVISAGAFLVGCGLWGYWRTNRQAFFLLVLPGLVTVLGLAVALGKMYPRYLFSLAGFAILIVVRGAMVLGALLSRLAGSPYRIAIGRAIGITCIALVITVSAASLARVYRLPKQDFTGAMRLVDSARTLTDVVLTAGAAAWPIERYYLRDWPQLMDIKQIAPFSPGRRVWLIYAFPRYIEDETPGLMDEIERRFRRVEVFPGTLEHGEVYVCVKDAAEGDVAKKGRPSRSVP